MYFTVLIYIGIYYKPRIKDYWGNLEINGIEYIIKRYIGLFRFQ